MGIEKIMHIQEELIKTYKKQISGLEKENASLRKMLDIQIAATIYTQACPRTSLFCFLLYQLSLWWVKYRAQPEAISTQNHAGRNAP